jgi:imidazolonepropionase
MSSKKLFFNFQLINSEFTVFKKQQAMIVEDGLIVDIGPQSRILKTSPGLKKIDLSNSKIFPSFVECHTHTVYAGSRADEFELRNNGTSYTEIARRGGGILSTVRQTQSISLKELVRTSQKRVDHFLKQGVSVLEIKSGYGLDLETEVKILKAIKKLKGPEIISTYLGAHAQPKNFSSSSDYLNYILTTVMPVLKEQKLSHRVDIFIEKNFFEAKDAFSFLTTFKDNGFDITIHANQLSHSKGVELALKVKACSADHVIHLTEKNIQQLARSNTVAVLLPTADLYMKCPYPPARRLIDAGASVALATDFNPGTCPSQDLMLVGLLARLKMKMTLPEVFKAYTVNAAKALNIDRLHGTLTKGKYANFICTQSDLSDFFYSPGSMPSHDLFIRGIKQKTHS